MCSSDLSSSAITNYSQPEPASYRFVTVTLDPRVPPERASRILQAAALEAMISLVGPTAHPPWVEIRSVKLEGVEYGIFYKAEFRYLGDAKPRVLQKYEVDESRCILCGICVDACPYDALRDGADFELAHESREHPTVDLLALSKIDRESEVTYIRREREFVGRAAGASQTLVGANLPVLPASVAAAARSATAIGDGRGDS